LLGLRFNPEDGGNIFLENVGRTLPDHAVLNPRKYVFIATAVST
jgi:hypothetical protein